VALLRSTGEGINLVTGGLDWHAGDEVILYELDFPSLVAPWIALGERGVNVAVVADRGRHRFEVEDFERLLSPRTRAISVSLVNNITGFRAPVEALAELWRARGLWFTVDAVQAIGSVVVDVPSLQADVVSAHGYKFQVSGFGYALVYVSDRAIDTLAVPHIGIHNLEPGDGRTLFESGLELYPNARRFEPSVPNLPAILAMGASLQLLLEAGPAQIDAHNRGLCKALVEGLLQKGYAVVTSQRPGESAGIVCAAKPGVDQESIREHLANRSIVCAVRGGRIRFSPHLFNTLDEAVGTTVGRAVRPGRAVGAGGSRTTSDGTTVAAGTGAMVGAVGPGFGAAPSGVSTRPQATRHSSNTATSALPGRRIAPDDTRFEREHLTARCLSSTAQSSALGSVSRSDDGLDGGRIAA
jgi:cysteine desulfurase/selenocysteine lyase